MAAQEHLVQLQFEDCLKRAKLSFAEQGMNAELYCRNEDERNYIHLVPTSAISGEGVPDLLMMLCKISQRFLAKKLQVSIFFWCFFFDSALLNFKISVPEKPFGSNCFGNGSD